MEAAVRKKTREKKSRTTGRSHLVPSEPLSSRQIDAATAENLLAELPEIPNEELLANDDQLVQQPLSEEELTSKASEGDCGGDDAELSVDDDLSARVATDDIHDVDCESSEERSDLMANSNQSDHIAGVIVDQDKDDEPANAEVTDKVHLEADVSEPKSEITAPPSCLESAGEASIIHDDNVYPTLDSLLGKMALSAEAPPREDSLGTAEATELSLDVEATAPELSVGPAQPAPVEAMPTQREIILNQRKTLTRVYPELDLEELDVLPMSEDEMLRINRGLLLQQREFLEDAFIEMYSEERLSDDELYKLLSVYYAERSALSKCSQELVDLRDSVQELRTRIWSLGLGQVSAYDRCGDNTRIEKSHEYHVASFERHQAARLKDELREYGALLRGEFARRNHSAQVLKTQIDQVLNKCLYSFRAIPKTASVPKIGEHQWGREQESAKEDLRRTISILFCFTRRPLDDAEFVKEIRQWLRAAVAVLLRVASLEDHFFIIAHVLRCPAGISKWAIELIQVPPIEKWNHQQNWSDVEFLPGQVLDYPMLALSLICSPVKQRDKFLRKFKALADETPADTWCILDSNGEDAESGDAVFLSWSESDVVDLLNQVPFPEIFKYMLLVDEVYDVDRATPEHMLQLISFSTHLVYTLHAGLRAYHSSRYRNLTKRISRFIRHCVEYLSDHWEGFRAANPQVPELTRIQVEYDQFLLRAVNSIFYSESLGAWQFMAVLPYKNVSHGVMWQLLWLLHNNYKENVQLVDMRVHEIAKQLQSPARLEEKIDNMDEEEVFYLLTTFANMAISREEANRAFVHTVVVEVFSITYLHERLRQVHSKVGRDLLSRLVSRHPFVVSVLLDQTHQHINKIGNMACYLFSGFDLSCWVPEDEDLDILYEFLVDKNLSSPENSLARLMLQNMNYGYDEKTNNLFLPEHHHQKVALILLAAYKAHYLPFDKTGYAYKQFKYISDYALGTKQPATPDGFIQYLWDLILRLHLHLLDYPHPAQWRLITDDDSPIGVALSLDNTNWLEPLRVGVLEGLPPALYMALMMCSLGHYREEIAERGVPLIVELVSKEQFTAAVEAVHRITAVFISKPELLVAHVKFLQAVESIIQADNTYATMVKNLVATSFPGDVLGQLARMIVLQTRKAKSWNLQTKCILMWLQVLLNLPEMSIKRGGKVKARESVHFLLDTLVQLAYQEVGCIDEVFAFLQNSMSSVAPSSAASGSVVRSVMSYVWWGSGSSWPVLVPLPSVKQFPWFAWAGLVAEGRVEQNCQPWKFLIKEMVANPRLTTESALKVISSSIKNVPSQEFLLIYRWAQLALDTEIDHPVLPLIWQQFFQLYLQRPPIGGSVGLRLFEGQVYHPILKQLKKRLNELAELYHRRHCDLARNLQDQPLSDHTKETGRTLMRMSEACQLFSRLQKYFRTLYLWLQEPRLHDPNVSLLALPPQYNPELLKELLCGNTTLWTDLVHQEIVEEHLDKLTERKNVPKVRHYSQPVRAEEQTIEQKILHRLRCYEEIRPPPPLPIIKLAIPEVTEDVLLRSDRLLEAARSELKTIMGHARAFNAQCIHLANLDENYHELLKKLYTNEDRSIELYMACSLGPKCKQHAKLRFQFHEAQKSKVIDKDVTDNRTEWTTLVCDLQCPPSSAVINACAFIESVITKLVNCLQLKPNIAAQLRVTGSRLFAELVPFMDKDCLEHMPTRQFLTYCLEVLGQSVICPDPTQAEPLLKLILRNPHLVSYLSSYFAPAVCEPSLYAEMYSILCYSLGPALYETEFILLSKFDVGSYLRATPTSALDHQNLIGTLEVALQSIGRKSELEPTLAKIAALYLNQMQALLAVNDFEHYIQILHMLLNGVRQNNIPLDTFKSFYEALGYGSIMNGDLPMHCGAPGADRIAESIQIIADFFKTFREEEASARRNGLYCLCEYYLNAVAPLYTLMGTLYILNKGQDMSRNMPSASDIEETLQAIFDLYEPWLGVIQDGNNLLFPWLPGEKEKVTVMLQSYRCVMGVAQSALYRINASVFNALWQRYFISYVWNAAPSYISTLYYTEMLALPWEAFVPNVQDLRLMTKVLEPKYADHLPFLTQLLLRVDWSHLLNDLAVNWKHEARTEAYARFVELLLKTGWDQTVVASGRTYDICRSVADADWSCLQVILVKDFLLVFETSCDPLCVLLPHESSQDDVIFGLMQKIACLQVVNASYATLEKQAAFFAMTVKLVQKCAETPGTRDLVKNRECVLQFLPKHMACVSNMVDHKLPNFNQQSLRLVQEVFSAISIVDNLEWVHVLTDGLVEWITANPGSELILPCLSIATTLTNQQSIPRIVEACITAYSKSEVEIFSSDGGWNTMLGVLRFPTSNLDELLRAAVDTNAFLTLYAYVMYKLPQCGSLDKELALLSRIVDWVVESMPTTEDAEPKILLLWEKLLLLSVRQLECGGDVRIVFRHLQRFSESLLQAGEDKVSNGLLGAMGFGRRSPYSVTFRFNSRVVAAIVAQHLTEDGLVELESKPHAGSEHKPHRFANEALAKVKAMQGNRLYAELSNEVDAALGLINSCKTLADSQDAVKQLVNFFYPTLAYLKVLFFGVL